MNSKLPSPNTTSTNPEFADDQAYRDLATLGQVDIIETDNLDETVLGAAAVGVPERLPPELIKGTELITHWDEPADSMGRRVPNYSDDGTVDVERLVEAGIEEADRERRLAVADYDEA